MAILRYIPLDFNMILAAMLLQTWPDYIDRSTDDLSLALNRRNLCSCLRQIKRRIQSEIVPHAACSSCMSTRCGRHLWKRVFSWGFLPTFYLSM